MSDDEQSSQHSEQGSEDSDSSSDENDEAVSARSPRSPPKSDEDSRQSSNSGTNSSRPQNAQPPDLEDEISNNSRLAESEKQLSSVASRSPLQSPDSGDVGSLGLPEESQGQTMDRYEEESEKNCSSRKEFDSEEDQSRDGFKSPQDDGSHSEFQYQEDNAIDDRLKSPNENSTRSPIEEQKSPINENLNSPLSTQDEHSLPSKENLNDNESHKSRSDSIERSRTPNEEEATNAVSNINLSHEDLSDVSDMESNDSSAKHKTPFMSSPPPPVETKIASPQHIAIKPEKLPEDGEEQLDFEAEDGECPEEPKTKSEDAKSENGDEKEDEKQDTKEEKDLEEGEVSDDDDARPEETEPRPVCRFYSRGQCTWGASCRFLHPGVTDKGHYTMFDIIRPVVPGAPRPYHPGMMEFRDERMMGGGFPPGGRPPLEQVEPPAESAWERGLRTAKEMMRKSMKRKEQDMDFEEKKMTLTLGQDELDKENGYYTKSAHSPPQARATYVHHPPPPEYHHPHHPPHHGMHPHHRILPPPHHHPHHPAEEYYGPPARRPMPPAHYEVEPPPPNRGRGGVVEPPVEYVRERERERGKGYREMPAHQVPDYYDKYEEPTKSRSRPNKREVIVQQPVDNGRGRADDWADPWMRSKSPAGGRDKRSYSRKQSYSSGSSYSSSSSSRSSSASSRSSSYRRGRGGSRSRSRSPRRTRHRGQLSPRSGSRHGHHDHRSGGRHQHQVSPSVIVSERKAANERASAMNPPAPSPRKNRPPSPAMMRKSAQNPPAPTTSIAKALIDRAKKDRSESDRKKLVAALAASIKRRSSRSSSGSDSSGSSSSDSESSYSSSSSSGDDDDEVRARDRVRKTTELAIALKKKSIDKQQIKLNLKATATGLRKPESGSSDSIMKKLASDDVPSSRKRLATSPSQAESAAKIASLSKALNSSSKKPTSRREELLKQLKAVEEAIAKKRSKIN